MANNLKISLIRELFIREISDLVPGIIKIYVGYNPVTVYIRPCVKSAIYDFLLSSL